VELLVLLAPALDFVSNRRQKLGNDSMAAWQQSGWLDVNNHASNAPEKIHYGLIEDIQRYDSYTANVIVPTLIFHGEHDESVPVEQSVRFAKDRNNVNLQIVDSDHSLIDQVDGIWNAMVKFFVL